MAKTSLNVRKRLALLLLPLTILTLTACQTTLPPSSSTIEGLVEENEIIDRDSACEALKPEKVFRAEWNLMTQEERNERAGEAAAWATLCDVQ